MLPLPELDDRDFKEIVDESKKAIPKLSPQWTDENYHDPGVTFIELFAWLAEMQQYYLNRITVKNELKFLKLMGARPNDAAPAKADVTFAGVSRELYLPKGTKLSASGQPFETAEPLLLVAAQIEKIIVFSDADSVDSTSSDSNKGVSYYAFGREAKKGSRFYVGFDRELPLGRSLFLTIKLYEDYPVPRGAAEDDDKDFVPPARVSWKYYGSASADPGTVPGWLPLLVLRDETAHLSRGGRILFQVPTSMKTVKIHPANDKSRFWICCTVEEEGYELSPRLDRILMNTVSAVQGETLSEVVSFSSSGQPDMIFEAGGNLPLYGDCEVQVRDEEDGWRYWKAAGDLSILNSKDSGYMLERNMTEKKVIIKFGNGLCGAIPPRGRDNIRLIAHLPSFAGKRFAGISSGLPHQIFDTSVPGIIPSGFKLQVGEKKAGSDEFIWRDWEMVDDFDASKPGDFHFALNSETGELSFGDNERGMIPPRAAQANICLVSCRTGGGKRGNVKENEINMIVGQADELRAITVTNYYHAAGGTGKESLEDAKRRVRRQLKRQFRAVSCQDFEEIAKTTPGLRVAKVKAIPLFEMGLKDYPQNKAPAQVTVVVVPYGESKKPVPSKGFLETVRRHLDKHRLITTEVHVVPPQYIEVTVHAAVVTAPNTKIDSKKIVQALDRLFQPVEQPDGSKGWPFGRAVSKGDIYGAINHIIGVEYIKDLWLDAQGTGIRKTQSGDIQIPPFGLVYSGEHKIEIVSRTDI
ncbi:MAG: Baseplate J-like protein [Pelotomaculum sp. PtaU1.Bin065]|nr:MAG: Baseplate J-like protein [Pelotomaculum sp. PtaU1.Bin065]